MTKLVTRRISAATFRSGPGAEVHPQKTVWTKDGEHLLGHYHDLKTLTELLGGVQLRRNPSYSQGRSPPRFSRG